MTQEDKIQKWLMDELSDSERNEFESSIEFRDLSKMMNALQNFKAPEFSTDDQYNKIYNQLFTTDKNQNKPGIINLLARTAAIILIVISIGYFTYLIFHSSVPQSNQWVSQLSNIYLPDSSFVSLNKESSIRYSKKDYSTNRFVELKGEAFFNVKKGAQFSVKTQQGIVTVLGTEFSINDRESFYEVTCYSGRVSVKSSGSEVVLHPQKSYRIINNKEEKSIQSNAPQPDWLLGESNFNSVPYSFVLKELERQYQVTIDAKGINSDLLFTGGFSNNNLELALKAITVPVNLEYKINDNKIVITVENK